MQEMPENGADVAHLGHLHVPSIFKGSDLRDIFAQNSVRERERERERKRERER